MKIGLIDVDGHGFPNFALMRLAGWHRAHGDSVEWCGDLYWDFDRVYKSKIFTFTPDICRPFPCEVIKGGTGYDIKSRLPQKVEQSTLMDYSLYPQYGPNTFILTDEITVLICSCTDKVADTWVCQK